jgi:type I restriction enzyme, S subunit
MSDLVPDGWFNKNIGDIATVFAGGTPSRSKPEYYIGTNPWVKSGEVNARQIFNTKEKISDTAIKESSAKWAVAGSVLVAMYGATAGQVAKLMINATLNQAVSAINGKNGIAHNDFLIYAIEYNTDELLNTVQGSGQPNLSGQLIKGLTIQTPPLPEQQKIAAILSSVDEVIEKTQAQINKLKDLKTGMMQELLSPREPKAGDQTVTQASKTNGLHHTEFKDSPLGRIPVGWEVRYLQDVATIQTGAAKNSKAVGDFVEMPYLRVANVQDGYLDLSEIKNINIEKHRVERFLLRNNDVLVNEGGDFDKLGRGSIWHNQVNPCVHQNHVFVVRTNQDSLLPMFFNHLSGSQHGKKYYMGCAKQTTNLASINSSQLKKFPVLLPPIDEQYLICEAINSIDEKINSVLVKLTATQQIKKALMQDLLTGKVRVQVDAA